MITGGDSHESHYKIRTKLIKQTYTLGVILAGVLSVNFVQFLGGIAPTPILYEAEAREPVVVLIGTSTTAVADVPKVPLTLQVIGDCESGERNADGTAVPGTARQFNEDGTIVKNPTSSATGKYQIMASLHAANARALGFDIYTEEGNESFALHLYDTKGAKPWEASASCHGIY